MQGFSMGVPSSEIERDTVGAGAVTARSMLLGAFMCFVIGIIGPYWTFWLNTGHWLFTDYGVGGSMFLLFVLVLLLNGGVGRFWKVAALRPGEMALVMGMMLVAGAITTMGLAGYLVPNITGPYYLATPHNLWQEKLWPNLPTWAAPLDRDGGIDSILKFYYGLKAGESIPWTPWVKPLLCWGLFVMALFGAMISLMVIMHKQWVEYERLSFPIAQVSQELCATAADPWRRGSLFRNKLFWFGFAVPFMIGVNAILRRWLPALPAIRLSYATRAFGPILLWMQLNFWILGFAFLIPTRVAFSIWFLNLLSYAVRTVLIKYGLEMQEDLGIYGCGQYPIMAHLGMGGMIVFVFASFYFARSHLKKVMLCVLGMGERDYDRNEPSSYLTAAIVLAASLIVMVAWLTVAGLALFYSCVLVAVALMIFFGLARLVAQCGLSNTIAPIIAQPFITSTFGGGNIEASGIGVLAQSWSWHSDVRISVMSSASHGMYLTRKRGGGLFVALMLAALITFLTATLYTVYLGYNHGAANLQRWYFEGGPKATYNWGLEQVRYSRAPNYAGYVWTVVGSGIMAGLILAQRALFWWPMHPVGFIVCSVLWTDWFWATMFVAWFLKVAISKLGGTRLYSKARMFFLGMILGAFSSLAVGAVVDTIRHYVLST